jgi:ankyrin repeat protein
VTTLSITVDPTRPSVSSASLLNCAGNLANKYAVNERGRTRERSEAADRQVLVAARDGSTSRIRNLFEEKDAHGWYQDENGMTALHYACASDRDDVEILEVLLGKGCADVNALNRAGESPLRLAINRKGAFSATARYLRDSGGKDLGPKPRQTSPVRRADPCATHEWIRSQSPPVRQATRSPKDLWIASGVEGIELRRSSNSVLYGLGESFETRARAHEAEEGQECFKPWRIPEELMTSRRAVIPKVTDLFKEAF